MPGDVCDCCGAPTVQAGDPIIAAGAMLALRALELVGKRLVKVERARYNQMRDHDRSWSEAHIEWHAWYESTSPSVGPDGALVDAALAVAWDQVPRLLEDHGCCGLTAESLTGVLDRYVRDLLWTQERHNVTELRYRLGAYLGLPVG